MVIIKEFIQFVLQGDDFVILLLLFGFKLFQKCLILGMGDHFLLWFLFFLDGFLKKLFLLDEFLDLFVEFLFLILIKICAVGPVKHDLPVPVVVLDDFEDLLFLIGSYDWKYFPQNHLNQGWVVFDKFFLQLMLVQLWFLWWLFVARMIVSTLSLVHLCWLLDWKGVFQSAEFLLQLNVILFQPSLDLLDLNVFLQDRGQVLMQLCVLFLQLMVLFCLIAQNGIDFRQFLLHFCNSSHIVRLLSLFFWLRLILPEMHPYQLVRQFLNLFLIF